MSEIVERNADGYGLYCVVAWLRGRAVSGEVVLGSRFKHRADAIDYGTRVLYAQSDVYANFEVVRVVSGTFEKVK